ncbi:hypothetical protein AN639_07780 [Candidatus Epulonipiscium fishelsonii]|uniref:Uncharacterized protein n=1 Tax=Candidatus Epulonipiscium fishelsonii TaxID=77094 RepID=A0ACC8XAT8_9FIRM|nr:hypothetical protein AN639_07780 [Epulopiscium sp. SCG-B05WGA-EpuloA1]ONI39565.1 hypothetical protein AN396_07950 [Epulopiscium sp. SCG-B11WGA-EpuloA1]
MKKLMLLGMSAMLSTGVVYANQTNEMPQKEPIENFSSEEKSERDLQRRNKLDEFVLKEDRSNMAPRMKKDSRMYFSPEEREEQFEEKLIELGYTQEEIDENATKRKEILLNILSKYNLTEEDFTQLQEAKKVDKETFNAKVEEIGITEETIHQIKKEVKTEYYKLCPEFEKIERPRKTNGMRKLQQSENPH